MAFSFSPLSSQKLFLIAGDFFPCENGAGSRYLCTEDWRRGKSLQTEGQGTVNNFLFLLCPIAALASTNPTAFAAAAAAGANTNAAAAAAAAAAAGGAPYVFANPQEQQQYLAAVSAAHQGGNPSAAAAALLPG